MATPIIPTHILLSSISFPSASASSRGSQPPTISPPAQITYHFPSTDGPFNPLGVSASSPKRVLIWDVEHDEVTSMSGDVLCTGVKKEDEGVWVIGVVEQGGNEGTEGDGSSIEELLEVLKKHLQGRAPSSQILISSPVAAAAPSDAQPSFASLPSSGPPLPVVPHVSTPHTCFIEAKASGLGLRLRPFRPSNPSRPLAANTVQSSLDFSHQNLCYPVQGLYHHHQHDFLLAAFSRRKVSPSLSGGGTADPRRVEPSGGRAGTQGRASDALEVGFDLAQLAWLAYVFKQVDSSNYKTAYVSGMKESLNFQGNELNYLDTFFRVGYALFLIPSQIILLKIRPSIWLPSLECLWGICTLLMAFVPSVKGMYVLRFFIGVFEASSFPGITCILCSWYTPAELATRLAIFGSSYPAAQIFVGFMQVALHEGMEGHLGLPGWKWLFIFNAVMTIIVAGWGAFVIPDSPGFTKVFWLTKEENELSKRRMTRMEKLLQSPFTLATVKRIFGSWVLWVFGIAYSTLGWSQNSNTWISLALKAEKNADGSKRFEISELNAIPIGGYVFQILVMFAFAWASGRFGGRCRWIVGQQMTLVVGNVILSLWPPSFGVRMLGFFILWLNHAAGAILIAWMADLCPSPEERAVIIGVACTFLYAVDSFANIFIYPAKGAPNYPIGYKAALAFAIMSIVFTMIFWWFERTDKTRCQCNHAALAEQRVREERNEKA